LPIAAGQGEGSFTALSLPPEQLHTLDFLFTGDNLTGDLADNNDDDYYYDVEDGAIAGESTYDEQGIDDDKHQQPKRSYSVDDFTAASDNGLPTEPNLADGRRLLRTLFNKLTIQDRINLIDGKQLTVGSIMEDPLLANQIEDLFLFAARIGRRRLVKKMLAWSRINQASIITEQLKRLALYTAIRYGRIGVVKALLPWVPLSATSAPLATAQRKPPPQPTILPTESLVLVSGASLLRTAARYGHANIIRLLLRHGAVDADASALKVAALNGKTDSISQLLLGRRNSSVIGYDVKQLDEALRLAINGDRRDAAAQLLIALANCAQPSQSAAILQTGLLQAIRRCKPSQVEWLVSETGDTDSGGDASQEALQLARQLQQQKRQPTGNKANDPKTQTSSTTGDDKHLLSSDCDPKEAGKILRLISKHVAAQQQRRRDSVAAAAAPFTAHTANQTSTISWVKRVQRWWNVHLKLRICRWWRRLRDCRLRDI
jgi:ankyrin repeat protein